jgi:hypothetical protein
VRVEAVVELGDIVIFPVWLVVVRSLPVEMIFLSACSR